MLTITNINAVTKKIGAVYEEWMQPLCKILDLPFTALCILMYFANNPHKNTAQEFCEHRGYKKAIVSIHIESLVQRGYLVRRAVAGDRRKLGIVCTSKATPIIEQAREYNRLFEESITDGLTKEDLKKIEEYLGIIKRNVENMDR